jgi:adenylylsulfate kinase-like enzyme
MRSVHSVLWLYGLSGSGKTTIASYAQHVIESWHVPYIVLDADELRNNYWPEVGLSKDARLENTRRIARLAKTYKDLGIAVVVAACAPFQEQRNEVLQLLPDTKFVYVNTSLDICKKRKPHTYADQTKLVNLVDPLPAPWASIDGDQEIESILDSVSAIMERWIPFIFGA